MDALLKGYRPYLVLATACVLLYAGTVSFGLSYLDDNILIPARPQGLGAVAEAFGQGVFHALGEYDAAYRPLLTVSFIIDAQLDRIFDAGYRFSNIAFHIVASCLVFLLFVNMKYGRPAAFMSALFFAVHPALVSVVAWIPGRNESLACIFILSGLIFLIKFTQRPTRLNLALHVIFLLAALFTKETALAIFVVGIFYSYFIAKGALSSDARKILFLSWILSLTAWALLRGCALSRNPIDTYFADALGSILSGSPAVLLYLGKSILPFNLSLIPTIEDSSPVYGIAALGIIALGLALSKRVRYAYVWFGALWFLSFLVPTFVRPVQNISAVFLESRLYIPIIGICMILAETDIAKNFTFANRKALSGALIITAVLVFMSVMHMRYFKDAWVFWRSAVERSPHSSMAQYNLGWLYGTEGRFDEAEARYRKSLELNPRQRYAHNGLGIIYERRGLLERASAEYAAEIINTPYYNASYSNLARVKRMLDQKSRD